MTVYAHGNLSEKAAALSHLGERLSGAACVSPVVVKPRTSEIKINDHGGNNTVKSRSLHAPPYFATPHPHQRSVSGVSRNVCQSQVSGSVDSDVMPG